MVEGKSLVWGEPSQLAYYVHSTTIPASSSIAVLFTGTYPLCCCDILFFFIFHVISHFPPIFTFFAKISILPRNPLILTMLQTPKMASLLIDVYCTVCQVLLVQTHISSARHTKLLPPTIVRCTFLLRPELTLTLLTWLGSLSQDCLPTIRSHSTSRGQWDLAVAAHFTSHFTSGSG